MVLRALLIFTPLIASLGCQTDPGGSPMFPDHETARHARDSSRGTELARTVERLDGVEEARVHLALADRSVLGRNADERSAAAVLVVGSPGKQVPEEEIEELVATAVAGLEQGDVKVFVSDPGPGVEPTVQVGPIQVAASSATTARLVLGAALGLTLLAALGLIGAGLKLRRRRGSRSR